MKTVMVFGADGMLGHRILMELAPNDDLHVIGVTREYASPVRGHSLFDGVDITFFGGHDAVNTRVTESLVMSYKPDVVLNCIGIIKQRKEQSSDKMLMIQTNALFPHLLQKYVSSYGGKVVTFSSDCVFSGKWSNHDERAEPDCESLYGRTKHLGEISSPGLTLRTSFIGFEVKGYMSLLEWFIGACRQQKERGEEIRGYTKAMWSGVTTRYVAQLMARIISEDFLFKGKELSGLYNLARKEPISKYELLKLVSGTLELDAEIIEYDRVIMDEICDRSLCGDKFEGDTGISVPDIDSMLIGLKEDHDLYLSANPERYG